MIFSRRNSLTALICLTFACLPLLAFGKKEAGTDTISARRAFIDMPIGVLDLLPKDTRLDMLDYYDNDSIRQVPNNLRGVSSLETVTSDFLSVRLTPSSTMQFKVLTLKGGKQIVMTVYTTGNGEDARDSEISFYDSQLQPLPKEKYFPEPKMEIFFDTKGYSTGMKEIEEILPFYSIYYEAVPGSPHITGRLTYNDILTVEDARLIELLAKPEVTFEWDGKKFRPANP